MIQTLLTVPSLLAYPLLQGDVSLRGSGINWVHNCTSVQMFMQCSDNLFQHRPGKSRCLSDFLVMSKQHIAPQGIWGSGPAKDSSSQLLQCYTHLILLWKALLWESSTALCPHLHWIFLTQSPRFVFVTFLGYVKSKGLVFFFLFFFNVHHVIFPLKYQHSFESTLFFSGAYFFQLKCLKIALVHSQSIYFSQEPL